MSRYIAGERVYGCGICRDTGFVEVWHKATVAFFRDVLLDSPPESWQFWERDERCRPHIRSIVMACNCERGNIERKVRLCKYDPDKFCLFDAHSGLGLYEWLKREHCYDPVTGNHDYGLSGEF